MPFWIVTLLNSDKFTVRFAVKSDTQYTNLVCESHILSSRCHRIN